MALRMPTFTDLYYSGVNIEGNSELKPERTSDLQVGARKTGRGYIFEGSLFYSHKTDMIDWVTFSNDGIFHSVNFRQNNWGAETGITLLPQEWAEKSPIRKIGIKYAYINVDSKYDVAVIKSKYAMDYLRNKVVVSADGRIWHNLNLHAAWRRTASVQTTRHTPFLMHACRGTHRTTAYMLTERIYLIKNIMTMCLCASRALSL